MHSITLGISSSGLHCASTHTVSIDTRLVLLCVIYNVRVKARTFIFAYVSYFSVVHTTLYAFKLLLIMTIISIVTGI